MIINKDILRRDVLQIKRDIDSQISVIEEQAKELGISAVRMRDGAGGFVMIPLLAAKAQVYDALIRLQT
jgi:hypothetical protein